MPWLSMTNVYSAAVTVAELSVTVPMGATLTMSVTGDQVVSLGSTYDGKLVLSVGSDASSASAIADLVSTIPSLPALVAKGILKRNAANNAWTFVTPQAVLSDAGAAIDCGGQRLVNVPATQFPHGVAAGLNGAGPITLTGAKVGDKVIQALEVTAGAVGADARASFEATITVANQIQQSSGSNLSSKTYSFMLFSQS